MFRQNFSTAQPNQSKRESIMSDAAAISAFNAAVDADRFAQARERELEKRIEALERALADLQSSFESALASIRSSTTEAS